LAVSIAAVRSAPFSASVPAILCTESVARLRQVGRGDVVVHHHQRDVEPEHPDALGGEAEVQSVAGVVLHDQQAARRAGHCEDAREHRVDRGRGDARRRLR
jgi:hypothetical protein